MRIRQVLLTYFNRRVNDTYHTKSLDEDWLQYRWGLFETFTVPTIRAQTCSDFEWVILCHRDSPGWMRERAKTLDLPCRVRFSFGVVMPVLEEGEIDDDLADLRDPSYDVILTTRVDSDDGLHRCAMQRIRDSYVADQRLEALNFETGYRYDCPSQRLEFVRVPSPAFGTKVNKPPFLNPLFVGRSHPRLPERYVYGEISRGDPMFLMVIHGDNVMNQIGGKPSFLSKSLSRHVLQEAFNVNDPSRGAPARALLGSIERRTRGLRRKLERRVLSRLPWYQGSHPG